MSTSSLTAKYRPQRFADVVGQDAVKAVLSRASGEDRIAPAYLFSGTRGVGKTTLARILAKAVNCEKAPTAEPCNECRFCRAVTSGAAVDVVEIDAASNRGIEDARRIKEDIGYAPIEGRYKVFIVDEAHMLTREAFNALLKTLEEPPGHACFVLATTEPHKFPATIVSRCQHYTFKRLTQKQIEDHLASLLRAEGVEFEPDAVAIIARRGAGSVRDAMSLLTQVLALGEARLKAENARSILGLAGQDVFFNVVRGVHGQDLPGLSNLLGGILDQGLDLGFFLRELGSVWRNLFLLKQAGDKGLSLLEMSAEEAEQWARWAEAFELAHIHACWQLTLEGQRKVLTSLEPAQAMELLLFNLASLPRLLDLDHPSAPPAGGRGPAPAPLGEQGQGGGDATTDAGTAPRATAPALDRARRESKGSGPAAPKKDGSEPASEPDPVPPPSSEDYGQSLPESAGATSGDENDNDEAAQDEALRQDPPTGARTWQGFLDHVARSGKVRTPGLNQAGGEYADGRLTVRCHNDSHLSRLRANGSLARLTELAREYFGPETEVALQALRKDPGKSQEELRDQALSHPAVKELTEAFGARMVGIRRI